MQRHTADLSVSMSRLAIRLQSLPQKEIADFTALLVTRAAHRNEADRRIAPHAPTPTWALSKVLLSTDLAPVIIEKLGLEDSAAAQACKLWWSAWGATVARRFWGSEDVRHIYSMAALGDKKLCVSVFGTDNTHHLLVLDHSFQVLHRIDQYLAANLLATQHGLYDWDDTTIRLGQLIGDSRLKIRVEKHFDEQIVSLAAAPDGTLFASAKAAAGGEMVVILDPLTLAERIRFGTGSLDEVQGVCVVGTEVYVCDYAEPEDEERYGRFQVFSLSGVYLREMRVDGMQNPCRLVFINGRLYVTDHQPGGTRIFVLTPDGASSIVSSVTVPSIEAPRLLPNQLCPFAGALLLLRGAGGSEPEGDHNATHFEILREV